LLQVILGRPTFQIMLSQSKLLICDRCFRTKSADRKQYCECGGTFEDFDLWKWVDESGSPEGDQGNDRRTLPQDCGGSQGKPSFSNCSLPVSDGNELQVASWKGRAAGLCFGNPRVRGIWNPAVLTCYAEHTLYLEAEYDPPGNPWIALVVTAVATVIAIAARVSLGIIGFIVGCSAVVSYVAILTWRKRRLALKLKDTCDVVVDEERNRIGFFIPFDQKARWIILEFGESFADVVDTIRRLMGPRCRTGAIRGTRVVSVIILLLLLFFLAFGYFMVSWTRGT
jgi:hypothetical protein